MESRTEDRMNVMDQARSNWAALPLRRTALAGELEEIFVRHYIKGVLAGRDAIAEYFRGNRASALAES
ncbi:MAG: hypothetical protein HKO62_02470 [Gammaproteobacteria bacterium]|nr:hypothetical protein [Gammaproteobacteria bacterium]